MKLFRWIISASMLCFALITFGQKLPFWGAKKAVVFETPYNLLKPGEYTWQPELSPIGPILVVVSLKEQRAFAYRNGILIGASTISSGKDGHLTPTGVFTTKLKDVDHHSSKYNNASMPYTQRLTNDGISLHAGGLPGYPSSHGCVHLPSEFARLLFKDSPLGMTVVIINKKMTPTDQNYPVFLSPVTTKGSGRVTEKLPDSASWRWDSSINDIGPLSIIISRADQRIVVMRNGTEIGRSKITIKNPSDSIGYHVLVAKNIDNAGYQNINKTEKNIRSWIALNFNDLNYENNQYEEPLNDSRILIPTEFMDLVIPQISEGTTVVITDDSIISSNSGINLTLFTSSPHIE